MDNGIDKSAEKDYIATFVVLDLNLLNPAVGYLRVFGKTDRLDRAYVKALEAQIEELHGDVSLLNIIRLDG